jgi:hypothetical protein
VIVRSTEADTSGSWVVTTTVTPAAATV